MSIYVSMLTIATSTYTIDVISYSTHGSSRSVMGHHTTQLETDLADSRRAWSSWVIVITDLCCLRVMMMIGQVVDFYKL